MKKIIVVLMLTFALFNFVIADDGHTPGGGKNCPNPAIPCLAEPVDDESLIIKVLRAMIFLI